MMDVGYCTNVHSGATLDETLANLDRYSVAVRERLGWDELPIGLWLSASAAEEALGRVDEIRAFLEERKLRVFTMNAFPYGDFHADVVKHAVYRPTWAEEARVEYTLHCARLLAQLIPEGARASISTLPIAWRADADDDLIARAGENLRRVAAEVYQINVDGDTIDGSYALANPPMAISVDLEPEPGCYLDRSKDVVRFFDEQLPEPEHRSVIGVCHDICHSAVMFESQSRALRAYRRAKIRVNKVQVSSAVCADGSGDSVEALREFVEDRYLHQTCVKVGKDVRFFEDLPDALAAHDAGELPRGEWRVHFHVPVHLGRIGELATTRDQVHRGLRASFDPFEFRAFEVETYAWNVLPKEHQPEELSEGIAAELAWVRNDAMPTAKEDGSRRDYLSLMRVSNLPTIWTNVIVGLAAGAPVWSHLEWVGVLAVGLVVSALYCGGMVLNDLLDYEHDRLHRPERPIASGRVSFGMGVFWAVVLLLMPPIAMVLGSSDRRFGNASGWYLLGLVASIVLYNWLHKRWAPSSVLMGVCRALVVLIAAASTVQGVNERALWVASAVGVYTVLLTLAARDEESPQPTISRVGFAWMTIGVLPALWFGLGGGTLAAGAMGVICGGWLARSAALISRGGRGVGAGIMGLLSGFCLVDAFALMLLDRPGLAAAAVGCFMLTTLGHRKVSGT